MAQYAYLNADHTDVQQLADIDPAVYQTWVNNSNPKALAYLPVTMTAHPAFDPATQQVSQSGWTIGASDVRPIWAIQTLPSDQQNAIAAQTELNAVIAGNIVTACDTYLNIANPTLAQSQAAVRKLVQFVKAFVKRTYGVTS